MGIKQSWGICTDWVSLLGERRFCELMSVMDGVCTSFCGVMREITGGLSSPAILTDGK